MLPTRQSYRSLLRITVVVMAVVLVFQSGVMLDRTAELFDQSADYLSASVGMSVSVAPTEYNTITSELTKQRQLLAAREAAVEEREVAVSLVSGSNNEDQDRTTYLLAAVLFVQLVLIVLNYGLDYLRVRDQDLLKQHGKTVGGSV